MLKDTWGEDAAVARRRQKLAAIGWDGGHRPAPAEAGSNTISICGDDGARRSRIYLRD
jgi:hypothetical protein